MIISQLTLHQSETKSKYEKHIYHHYYTGGSTHFINECSVQVNHVFEVNMDRDYSLLFVSHKLY